MMEDQTQFKSVLKKAGLSDPLIEAAWPAWWSDDAFGSVSAQTELRFTIARKLGLSASSLLEDKVEYIWRDEARFKRFQPIGPNDGDAITSFGMTVAQLLLRANESQQHTVIVPSADVLRRTILEHCQHVSLVELLAACWAMGIPVIQLELFPLPAKRMDAMVVSCEGRPCILLARNAKHPAPIAFILAHELGHISNGHLTENAAVVDFEADNDRTIDAEERDADKFALQLLTGHEELQIEVNRQHFNPKELADAAIRYSSPLRVEAGTLALCVGHTFKRWDVAHAALKLIYGAESAVGKAVNQIAQKWLDFSLLDEESGDYLSRLIGDRHD